jgi:hypothetical protein
VYSLFFDNTDRLNYGCRATSLALGEILLRHGQELRSFHGNMREVKTRRSPSPAGNTVRGAVKDIAMSKPFVGRLAEHFTAAPLDSIAAVKLLKRRAKYSERVKNVLEAIDGSDAIFINGEGSMIFTTPPRPDLKVQIMLLAYASSVGVDNYYVNAMVSPCPLTGVNQASVDESLRVLESCENVFVRDPVSFEFLADLGYKSSNASMVPDALFGWADTHSSVIKTQPVFEVMSGMPEGRHWSNQPSDSEPYLCLSGASIPPGSDRLGWIEEFGKLQAGLQASFGKTVIMVPDVGDDFLGGIAEKSGSWIAGPDFNVFGAASILSHAQTYVSGRYHPSIMAALGGTPLVHFGSNSHKCSGLRQLLGLKSGPEVRVGSVGFADALLDEVATALSTDRSSLNDVLWSCLQWYTVRTPG